MSLASAVSREATATGTGSVATYAFSFKVYSSADLRVTVATNAVPPVVSTLALTTDYTVTLSSPSTLPSAGTITLVAGNLASGYLISIRRVLAITQPTDLINQGSFAALTHEQKFDKLVMICQQLKDEVDRSLKLPEYEAGTAAKTILPDATGRASLSLGFDSSGNPVVS